MTALLPGRLIAEGIFY